MFPSFIKPCFLIGASKAATTSLSATLDSSPSISVANPKECMYYNKLYRTVDYSSFFKISDSSQYFLDGSTHYSHSFRKSYTTIPARIFNDWPNAKIIYVLRNYSDRLASLKSQMLHMGILPRKDCLNILSNDFFLDSFLYSRVIESYLSFFGQSNILVLSFEDFIKRPSDGIQAIFNFLGLNCDVDLKLSQHNISSSKTQVPLRILPYVHKFALKTGLYNYTSSGFRHAFRNLLSRKNPSALDVCSVSRGELRQLLTLVDSHQALNSKYPILNLLRENLLSELNNHAIS